MSGPAVIDSAEVLLGLVGTELGPSRPLVVTQERIDAFADATGDHQWIHSDPERAATGPYGGTIARGCLTLSLIPALAADLYDVRLGTARVNYGLDRVRFPAHVPVGAQVSLRCTVDEVTERPDGWLVAFTFTMDVAGSARPACVARKLSLVVR